MYSDHVVCDSVHLFVCDICPIGLFSSEHATISTAVTIDTRKQNTQDNSQGTSAPLVKFTQINTPFRLAEQALHKPRDKPLRGTNASGITPSDKPTACH